MPNMLHWSTTSLTRIAGQGRPFITYGQFKAAMSWTIEQIDVGSMSGYQRSPSYGALVPDTYRDINIAHLMSTLGSELELRMDTQIPDVDVVYLSFLDYVDEPATWSALASAYVAPIVDVGVALTLERGNTLLITISY